MRFFRLETSAQPPPHDDATADPRAPDGVRMEVARYTRPREPCRSQVAQQRPHSSCPTALRTRFIVCTLRHGDDGTAWIVRRPRPSAWG